MTPLLRETRTRIGLIIPSSNRMTELQMRRYAPDDVDIHVTRLRMTGAQYKPISELRSAIAEATLSLADARCDAIVFHSTASAMESGLDGNALVCGIMRDALPGRTDVRVTTAASAALAALAALRARTLLLLSPYVQTTHDHEVQFLTEAGLGVGGSYCLGLPGSDQYIAVRPDEWLAWARSRLLDHPLVEAIFLSCANTRTPEVVQPLEARVGRPVITSNSAVLWYALRLCGRSDRITALGRLFQLDVGPWSDSHARQAPSA